MRLGITECLDSNAVSTAKANRTVWIKARSPIESDVGNYEQEVVKWRFSAKKARNFEGRRKKNAQNY